MLKPISISFAPNFEKDDAVLALKLLLRRVSKKRQAYALHHIKKDIGEIFISEHVFLFSSGRAALYYTLQALGIGKEDEIILQGFTCVAVPNAIIWTGATPVFVDIDPKTYNIDIGLLKKKVTAKTKAIIVQHTFGIPANINEIVAFAKKQRIFVIEDCPHSLNGKANGKKLGTFGDIAILSFGRDKIVSSVFGGAVVTIDPIIGKKLMESEENLVIAPTQFINQQLVYLIVYSISMPLYQLGLGKAFLWLSRRFGLLSRAVYDSEKKGKKPLFISYSFPSLLTPLLAHQIKKLDRYTIHRIEISNKYIKDLNLPLNPNQPYLRIPILVEDKQKFLARLKKKGIHLGNWYRATIDPPDSDYTLFNYQSCPTAEKLALHTVNLPTHINISEENAQTIVAAISPHIVRSIETL